MVFLVLLLMSDTVVHSWTQGYHFNEGFTPAHIPTGTAYLIFGNCLLYLLVLYGVERKIGYWCLVLYYALRYKMMNRAVRNGDKKIKGYIKTASN
jgi:hypothetical protein